MIKTIRKTTALALALMLMLSCFSFSAFAISTTPADIQGMPCEKAVGELIQLSIVSGYPDGTYKPDGVITRAEASKLLVIALGLTEQETELRTSFSDTKGHWAEKYIAICASRAIFAGDTNGAFSPDEPALLDWMCKVLFEALGYDLTPEEALAKAVKDFGVKADTENTLTRGVFASLLYAVMQQPIGEVKDGKFEAYPENANFYDTRCAALAIENGTVMRGFVLAAYYENDTINAAKIAKDPDFYVYSTACGGYAAVKADESAIKYNFAAVYDTDSDKLGDTVLIVKYADASKVWDDSVYYIDPRAGEDDAYKGAYEQAYSIPFGERMLTMTDSDGYLDGAVYDYSNIVKPGDLENSTYYPTYDWYNTKSTDTLTFLSKFKTTQQSTGWACGVTSALMVTDYYGLRNGLNDLDLGALRNKKDASGAYVWGGASDVQMLINVFDNLNKIAGKDVWQWESTYDFVKDGEVDEDYLSTDFIVSRLSEGKPILVGWNAFGGHWQVIIGYDTMGTEGTQDDVLILADPYDSTDHRNDGVTIQSYERLYYDYTQGFDRDFSHAKGFGMPVIFIPSPVGYDAAAYKQAKGGLSVTSGKVWTVTGNHTDNMLIPYGDTAKVLSGMDYPYTKANTGKNGLAGPASSDWYRKGDVASTPYYAGFDFFAKKASDISPTLKLLEGFKTSQQASEWTCGPASLRMALEYMGVLGATDEFTLAALRENDKEGATTLDGMVEMITRFSGTKDGYSVISTDDLDDDLAINGYYLESGSFEDGLIPSLIANGIPVIIGWNEWGGHWQVIIGYDDMGTDNTQDDVIILADPYDTTDHNQDGYVVESFERLVYGWGAAFDTRASYVFTAIIPDSVQDYAA